MSQTLKPIRDQVVIRRKAEETVSKGGIVIPGTAQEKSVEGEVLAVGTGKVMSDGTVVPLEIKVGDRVLFHKHGFMEVKLDNEEYLIGKEEAILGTIVTTTDKQ